MVPTPFFVHKRLLWGRAGRKSGIMKFYVMSNNTKQGPYTIEELQDKGISANTMVWKVGLASWQPAYKIEELMGILSELPPEIPQPPMPKSWLVESILVTCFCCLPFGIIGIINSTKIETAYKRGDFDEAMRLSDNAKKWTLWGFLTALACGVIYLLILLIIALIGS